MELLAGLACALVAVTLVGHGIWVVIAAMIRAVSTPDRPPPRPRPVRREECPGCAARLVPDDRDCPNCGLPLDGRTARRLDRVRTAEREVRELADRAALDRDTADLVLTQLARRADELLHPPAEPAEPPPTARLLPPTAALPLPTAHATLSPAEPPPVDLPPAEPGPRRGVLAAFMEERNILWGEVVGGLLVVGCSIALVLSLWRTLEAVPYFPFLLSAAITAAVFAAGQYTLHHWKLAATSRGLLVIALLLAPLNLLLLARPGAEAGVGWLDAGVKLAAVAAFVGVVRAGGRDLIGTALLPGPVDRRWLLAAAVVGAPASQVIPTTGGSWLHTWLPAVWYAGACGAVLAGLTWYRGRERHVPLARPQGLAVLTFVGLSLFALFAAWGWMLTSAGDMPAAATGLAVPLALTAVLVTEAGLLVHRRTIGHPGLRAAGTGGTAAGGVLLLTAGTLAWPDPAALALVAAVAGVVFTVWAWREGVPWFQAGAVPAVGLAVVLGVHGLLGGWGVPAEVSPTRWLWGLFGSITTGETLVALALLLAGVAEVVVRFGHRPQAVAYAVGGLAAGVVGLFVITVRGVEEPWPAVGCHAAAAAGLLAANARWQRRILAEVGVWLILVGSVWAVWAVIPDDRPRWGPWIAAEALTLAGVAWVARRRRQVRIAAADAAVAAGLLAIVFTVIAPGFPHNPLIPVTLSLVAGAAFLLTRVFVSQWPTWFGSPIALLGLAHYTVYTAGVQPTAAAILLALLGHATLAVVAALAVRRYRRLYAGPLLWTGLGSSVLAVPFVLYPLAGFVPEWVGFTAWLAAVWFMFAWRRRDPSAFAAGQGAVVWATALVAFVWVERQPWWATTALGFRDPRGLQALGVGLAAVALLWAVVRGAVGRTDGLLRRWLRNPAALDRLVTGGAVVAAVALLAVAVLPGVNTEMTPLGGAAPPPPAVEHAHAFGPGTWLVLGLFAVALVAGIRVTSARDGDHDAPVLGLAVLLVGVPVALAGTFAPEVAVASALRWGLAGAFLAGTAVLVARKPLGRFLPRAGLPVRVTGTARLIGYGWFAATALVVVVLTAQVAALGLSDQSPSGPADHSVFARMGWTASNVVPLVMLIAGLSATATRERSAGYAFAGGLMFTGTAVGGYALAVVTAGGALGPVEQVRLAVITAGSVAAWSLGWQAAARRVPGGMLLAGQTLAGLLGVAALVGVPLVRLFLSPAEPLPDEWVELGRWGWAALGLAGWAGVGYANRRLPPARPHVVGVVAVAAGVFAACAVRPWDEPGRSLSFHTMAAVWAVAGIALAAVARGTWVVVLAVGVAAAAVAGPTPPVGRWPVPLALAGYALVLALVARTARSGRRWAVPSFAAVGVTAAALAVWVAVGHGGVAERLAGPLTIGLLAVGLGVLELRVWSAITGAVGLVLTAWAVPDPDIPPVWLHRSAWAFVAVVAAVAVGLEGLPRILRSPAWAAAVRRVAGGLFPVAAAAVVTLLLQQVLVFDPVTRRTPLALPAVLAGLGGIAALVVLSFRFAVTPAADPYRLPDARRGGYVYLAELFLVLFFVHVRLNLPEVFVGQMVRYWTFLVMLLAFVWVGLADLFERRRAVVLARPMRRTGVLLPLIPLVAFWAKPPAGVLEFADARAPGVRPFLGYLEKLPQHFDAYSGLWLLAGTLYGLIALSRRSFGWALLAALAANAGVWSLLAHTGVSAAAHPQVWVIPLALIVLVSEHVNRRELRADVAAGLRYLGVGLIYGSSAADLFIAGVGETWWLPVVLAVLCLGGMLTGILLRVRAFLFLGAGFLALDVFAMIWHAAVDRAHTWVWYASGVALGAVILALFAVFEKRRNDVLAVVDRVRHWD